MPDDPRDPETATTTAEAPSERPEIGISRYFDAPPELVFEAFTDADVLGEWWGPDGFTTTTEHFDFRPDGSWEFVMHGPDGTDYPNYISYEEIVEPERIVYDHGSTPDEVLFGATVTFDARGDGTLLTMRQVYPTIEARDRAVKEYGAVEGGTQTLGRLAALIEEGASEGGA